MKAPVILFVCTVRIAPILNFNNYLFLMNREEVYIIGTVWSHFKTDKPFRVGDNITMSVECKYCSNPV